MDMSFYLRGLILGLSIASVVGPMSVLCMQRTIHRGLLYGLISGLGIATADGVYGSIAAFGLTLITTFLVSQQIWIRLIGGLFLLYLGIRTIFTKPAERAASAAKASNFLGAYVSTFLLTLTNSLTIGSLRGPRRRRNKPQRHLSGAGRSRRLLRLNPLVVLPHRQPQPVTPQIYPRLAALDQQNFRRSHYHLRAARAFEHDKAIR